MCCTASISRNKHRSSGEKKLYCTTHQGNVFFSCFATVSNLYLAQVHIIRTSHSVALMFS